MKSLKSFYWNKKVLITGHTGFKGSWLTIWLQELGARIVGIALDPVTDKELFYLAGLQRMISDYRQDIRDLDKVVEIFVAEQPEIVFHLAAQALVLPGYVDPAGTFSTNTMGTVNILEACRLTPSVRQIVIITTDKVYENREVLTGYREEDPLGGYDPYSASKAAVELITQSYRLSFSQSSNQSISTARAGNVIGGGDWSEYRLVPDCIRSLEAGEKIIIRNPESVRPWQHVLEPLYAYLLLAVKMSENPAIYCGAWNFGPKISDFIRVEALVNLIIKCWGNGEWQSDISENKPHEATILRLNIDKAKQILGWRPVLNLEETVNMTIDWYKRYLHQDGYAMCALQIKEYSDKWNSAN